MEKNEHVKKSLAGKLLSKFIREIASEICDDPEIRAAGEDAVMITKAEKLARWIWKAALGYSEDIDVLDKAGKKIGIKLAVHKPNKTYIGLIYDRLEGRVAMMDAKSGSDKISLADKVSGLGTERVNQIAKQSSKRN